ncbi:hypothetical protein RoseRS_0202 [Roseiflexus sp. RS-1]|nr:hypothetical protein RoseRS_0202 [Roseiflexus sp. RS-1]
MVGTLWLYSPVIIVSGCLLYVVSFLQHCFCERLPLRSWLWCMTRRGDERMADWEDIVPWRIYTQFDRLFGPGRTIEAARWR